MNTIILFLLVLSYSSLKCSESAKILGVFPAAGKSMNIQSNKLMVALANQGHDITLIAGLAPAEKPKNGSLRYIHLTGFYEAYDSYIKGEYDAYNYKDESNIWATRDLVEHFGREWNKAFKIPEVKKLIDSNETFDALVIEDTWMDSLKILSLIYNCPVIVFSCIGGNNNYLNAAVGNPLPPSYIPHIWFLGPYFNGMTFFQRVGNFIFYLVDTYTKYYISFPIHNNVLRSNFENPPDIATFYDNISLVLLGSHTSLRQSGPLLPNIIEIGGFHIDPPKELPKDIQEFLDGATDGAIYFSFGTHVDSKDMPEASKKMFLDVLGKLKQRVLWKFEEDLPNKPKNILIRKWLPQTDILAHPNVKVFITHAGYGSTIETAYNGVPALMFPIFFDQFNNANQAVQKGYALKLSLKGETEATLTKALEEILYNPKYRHNAKKIQQLFHDRPMKPMDTAIYWIEYVIRHKGAHHLKVVGLKMPWYQFYSIDVILFLLGFFFAILYFCYFLLSKIIFGERKSHQKQKTQ